VVIRLLHEAILHSGSDAKLLESVEFAHFRNGAETPAIEAGADLTQTRLLAGHRTGISDHYVRRSPTMVADDCAAIEGALLQRAPTYEVEETRYGGSEAS
jgi:hypothetical protein